MICIGTILKSHKTEGEFLCRLFNELLPDKSGRHRLSELQQIEIRKPSKKHQSETPKKNLASKKLELTKLTQQTESKLLLQCREWKEPEEVQPYHGWEIWVEQSYASPCDKDEFLYCELIGAQLYYRTPQGNRQELGRVQGLMEGGAQLLLEITEKSIYLPFHHSIIGEVDTSAAPTQIEVLSLEYFEALLNL